MNKELISKLGNVQANLKAPKDKFNSFGGYNYRSCESILEAVKPLLEKQGLMLFLSDSIEAVDGWKYVKATATLTDGTDTISTSAYAREPEAKKGMDSSQVTGTASSYARKYALNGLFLIDDTKDADTDEYQRESKKSEAKAEKPAPAKKAEVASDKPVPLVSTAEINKLLEMAAATNTDIGNMCRHYGVSDIKLMNKEQYLDAVLLLEKKGGSK